MNDRKVPDFWRAYLDLFVPVPEPSTVAFAIMVGLCALVVLRRRSR